ncbi:MAG TPA: hypothetical protein VIF62_14400, partial [Labilithrix sp.]
MSFGSSTPAKIVVVVGVGLFALGAASIYRKQSHPAPRVATVDVASPAVTPADTTQPPPKPVLKQDAPAARVDPNDPAIVDAVVAGDLARIASLHDKGVHLDGTLVVAARTGRLGVVKWLLDHGVDVHENEGSTQSPLLVADAYPDVTKLLLDRGAHEPSMEDAIREPAANAVERILGKGADANASILDAITEADGDEGPHVTIVRSHVAHGARIESGTLRAAIDLSGKNRDAVLDALLAGKLDRDATLDGASHAAERRDAATIRRLGAKGIAWNLYDTERGEPALVIAARTLDLPT